MIRLLPILFLAGCATVGPVEITEDDSLYTILAATLLAVFVFFIKGLIEFLFAMLLEKYKRNLDSD